jgi:hypothetical protein
VEKFINNDADQRYDQQIGDENQVGMYRNGKVPGKNA